MTSQLFLEVSKMSKTNPRISLSNNVDNSFMNAAQELSQLPLKRFCTKKLHEVEFAYPFTICDNILLQQIVDTGKNYEYVSGVHFVTYEDVLNLIDRLVQTNAEIDLPKGVKECARHFVTTEFKKMSSMSLEFLAILTKLKIIESMYKVYRIEVINMQRRKEVHEDLSQLLHNGEPQEKGKNKNGKEAKKGEKGKKSKSSESSKSKGKTSKSDKKSEKSKKEKIKDKKGDVAIDDYTEIILEGNETIFDYNVDNHLQYFVLTGFDDPQLLRELINLSVYISAVIDVSFQHLDPSKPETVILKLEEIFETPKTTSYLENTVWMKYRNDGNTTPKQTLEEFLYVVKRINFIKRQHLAYTKELILCNVGATPDTGDFECIEKYNRILNSLPSELINIPLIVNVLIKEICWREAGKIYSASDLTPSSESEDSTVPKPVQSFQAHEEDFLKMGMKAYHETGRRCYDHSLEYFKLLQPLTKVDHYEQVSSRTVGVSTEDTSCTCSNNIKDLLDYFHLAVFCQMKRRQFEPKQPQEYYLTENLVTHSQVKEYERAVPKGAVIYEDEKIDLINNYHLKEDLSSTVLYQLIFRAMMDYSSWDRYYCDVSNAILLRFHDNLTDFGIDTKLWDQVLRTPVCLRDFCRFLVNEVKQKEWLIEHKLTDHAGLNEVESEKECEGLIDMHIPEVYEEYQYLLGVVSGDTSEEKKKTFDDVITELVDYPKSEILTNYCSDDASFIAYDLGPKLCQLTGHTTIFHSDDGVKVTVDTTRFMVEDPKCSVTIDADGNSFVFHKTRPSAFHFILKDETIVSFSEFETSQEIPQFFVCNEEFGENYQFEGKDEEEGEEEQQEEEETRVPNYNDYWIQVLRKSKINTTIPNFFDKPNISDRKVKLDNKNLNRLLELFKAAVYVQRPIYKISTKSSIRRLKRTMSPLQVPLAVSLKRVLFKPLCKKRRIGGYSVLNIPRTKKKASLKYDFKITLPNGILISTLPRNKPFAEIKQEYKYKQHKELYRIFYSSGVVIIKNFDGTTTILRSNGDIIELTDESECHSVKCAKNMTQIFRYEEDNCPYRLSRCRESPRETIVKTTFVNLYEFGDIPYTKKTLLQFEGKIIYVTEDNIYEKQLYYVLSEHDYHAEEVFYEREDGMKCIINKKGITTFQFPDSTKITSWPEFETELIFLSKKSNAEGWVSVVINYKFEHPDYVTVEYFQADRSTRVFLKDGVVKNFQDSFLMSTNTNVVLEVSSDNIIFLKSCKVCDEDCICEIHIQEGQSKLLEVYDSYEKHLVCDRFGQLEINSNYIKTSLNKSKCNHRWRHEKQKFFIINERGPPGTLLWKDSFVEDKVEVATKMKHIKVTNYMNKLIKRQTVEFFTQVHENFIIKFTMTYKQRDISLAKYQLVEEPQIYYVTYRILIGFQNLLEDRNIIAELREFLETHGGVGDFMFLLEGIKQMITYATDYEKTAEDKLSFQVSMKDGIESSSSSSGESKNFELPKIKVEEVIAKWRSACKEYRHLIRNKIFSPYFHSEYYLNVLESLKGR